MSQGTRFVYTINNPEAPLDITEPIKYHVFGSEVAPTTDTPHLQGFIIFERKIRLTTLIRRYPGHWEVARGSNRECSDYCKKDGDFVEEGIMPLPAHEAGGRAVAEKWTLAKEAAIDGRLDDIPDDLFIRYYGTFKRIRADYTTCSPANDTLQNFWIHGPSGVGKSRIVRQVFPHAYLKMINKWWDGYSTEETVLIDDVDPDHKFLRGFLKIWSDHYPFRCESKGTTAVIRPRRIIVTSQYPIAGVFEDSETQSALNRRFRVLHYANVQTTPFVQAALQASIPTPTESSQHDQQA